MVSKTRTSPFSMGSVLVAGLLLVPPHLSAQVEIVGVADGRWEVVGSVVDSATGALIDGAAVRISTLEDEPLWTVGTDGTGVFQFDLREAGLFRISVSRLGYSIVQEVVEFPEEGTVILQVALSVEPVPLEGVEAMVRRSPRESHMNLVGFEARRLSRPGIFIDEEEIVKRNPSRITDLLIRASGVRLLRDRGRIVDIEILRSAGSLQGGRCLPAIWLDGLRIRAAGRSTGWNPSMTALNDLIPPEQVGGIEVYVGPARTPVMFSGTGAQCGVVVIWSRR